MRKVGLKVLVVSLTIVFSLAGAPMVMTAQASDAYYWFEEPDHERPTIEEMREEALNRIEDATEEIQDVRADAEELKITVPEVEEVLRLITQAERGLAKAKTAFDEGNYGSSFIYAGKAETLTENADALLDEIEEAYERDWEIEVEIAYQRAYVEVELDEVEMEFTLDTTNKEEIIQEIMARTGLCRFMVEMITTFEFDDEIFEEIKELASELREALYEQGEAYLEILEEIRETMLAIEEDLKEFDGLKMELMILDIEPWIRDILINKLTDIWSSIEEMTLLVREGRVVEAHGEIDKIILSLVTFITAVEIYLRDEEILLERAEEIAEDARDWKETLKDLIPELREILIEFDEAVRDVQCIASELEALGGDLEVTVEKKEKPMVTSAWITTTITAGGVTVKEASSCVTALKLEKPLVASLMGIFKHEILKHFEVKTTLPDLDKRLFPLIFPHTLGKLILIEGENPAAILAPSIFIGGIRGEVAVRTIKQFLALVTVERNVFGPINERLLAVLGVGFVFRPEVGYQKITDAPGMDEWRTRRIGWTHKLPGYPFDYPVVTVIPPRLTIRARIEGCLFGEDGHIYIDGHFRGYASIGLRGFPVGQLQSAIPCQLLEDGRVTINIQIIGKACVPGRGRRGIKVDWSKLEWGLEPEWGLVVEIIPMVREVSGEEMEWLREWLRQQGIDREDIGEYPEIWVWRTVRDIKDGDGFFVKEPIVRSGGWWPHREVRIKGLDTPEVRYALRCDNQYHHAAVATSRLRRLIPRGTIVRIESYYPFKACIHPVRRTPWRIQACVFKAEDNLDIAKSMIHRGYGVAAVAPEVWVHDICLGRAGRLLLAQQAAKEAIPPRGIWNDAPPGRLLLHPHYFRLWTFGLLSCRRARELSRIRLSHAE